MEGGIDGYIDSGSEIIYYIAIPRGARLDIPHVLKHVMACEVFFLRAHEEAGESMFSLGRL